jgi:catechol 2,3-dioxygenase-like lactoylglutathione lyase family enzyme
MDVRCSCCGQERPTTQVGALACHTETIVCRDCINWLQHQAGMVESTPTLPVIDMPETIAFYESAGFDVHAYSEGFAFVQFEGVSVFDLDHHPIIDRERNGAGCFMIVPDSDAWHERLTTAGLPVTSIENMPWGMREFALTDPNGNRVRIGTST